jgi:hypothetical protein
MIGHVAMGGSFVPSLLMIGAVYRVAFDRRERRRGNDRCWRAPLRQRGEALGTFSSATLHAAPRTSTEMRPLGGPTVRPARDQHQSRAAMSCVADTLSVSDLRSCHENVGLTSCSRTAGGIDRSLTANLIF